MNAEELLEKLLNIPTVNGKDDEGVVACFIAAYLKECGLDTQIQKIDEKHSNVIAKLSGKTQSCVLWNGHIDTVPYGELKRWKTDPAIAVRDDDIIYARGASDMKSGLAAMVYVLGELGKRKYKPEKTIVFLGSCDEEKSGLGAGYFAEHMDNFKPEFLLIGEPTSCNLGVAQKGCLWLKVKVDGSTSHGAEPERGANAIEQGFLLLMELKKWIYEFKHEILGNATMQINLCNGGIAPNMTADFAEFTLDIRIIPGLSVEMILEKIQDLFKKFTNQNKNPIQFHIDVINKRFTIEIEENSKWVECFQALFSNPVKKIGINYFTDASILCLKWNNLPVILFGPGEPDMCHKENEYVKLSKYAEAIDILFQLCNNCL